MTTYNYYLDKRLNHENDNYVNVNLPYPLECDDNQYFKIKLVDFSYLNNEYNISQKLQNNLITLRKIPLLRTISFTNAPNTVSFSNDVALDIFNDGLSSIKTTTTLTEDITDFTQSLTGENYRLIYKDPNLQPGSGIDIGNLFQDIALMDMVEDVHHLIIEKLDTSNLKILRKISFAYEYDAINQPPLPVEVSIKIKVQGSQDNVTYTDIDYLVSNGNGAVFVQGENVTTRVDVNDRELSNAIPYRFYKFSTDSSLPTNTGVLLTKFKLVKLFLEEAEYTFVDVPQTPVTYNRTITDGFYNSTNYVAKINEILEQDLISVSLDNITNKLSFSNTNTTPTYDVNPTDDNGIVQLQVATANQKHNLGIIDEINTIYRTGGFTTPKAINLVNFTKLVLACDFTFRNNTHNDLIVGNDINDGIGNILCWIPNDSIPFSYINYKNYEMNEYRINDKYISNIKIRFYNEKRQPINIDNALIHFQIKKMKK